MEERGHREKEKDGEEGIEKGREGGEEAERRRKMEKRG